MDTGINPPDAYNGIYGTKRVQHMHLLARILNTASTNSDESVAWMLLKKEDIDKFGSDVEDTHAFINNLLVLNNIKVAWMFRDDGDQVKMSLRSSGDIDVGTIAQALGGGGHSHSAATVFFKNAETTEKIILRAVKKVEEVIQKILKES
jgi:phosphoesterase RecJ-like protein